MSKQGEKYHPITLGIARVRGWSNGLSELLDSIDTLVREWLSERAKYIAEYLMKPDIRLDYRIISAKSILGLEQSEEKHNCGWDGPGECPKHISTSEEKECVCREPEKAGSVHRQDGPCYQAEKSEWCEHCYFTTKAYPPESIFAKEQKWWHDQTLIPDNWIVCPICAAPRPKPLSKKEELAQTMKETLRSFERQTVENVKSMLGNYKMTQCGLKFDDALDALVEEALAHLEKDKA